MVRWGRKKKQEKEVYIEKERNSGKKENTCSRTSPIHIPCLHACRSSQAQRCRRKRKSSMKDDKGFESWRNKDKIEIKHRKEEGYTQKKEKDEVL